MAQKLGTFKIDEEKWEAFKALAEERKSSASEMIKEFIDWALAGNSLSIDPAVPDDIDSRIEALLDKKLDERLGKSAA